MQNMLFDIFTEYRVFIYVYKNSVVLSLQREISILFIYMAPIVRACLDSLLKVFSNENVGSSLKLHPVSYLIKSVALTPHTVSL